MIDPATGWFEIAEYDDKRAISIANIFEQVWLSRYLRPSLITFDRGNEFIGDKFKNTCKKEHGIKTKPITVKNPQANAIIERVHQVIANMMRTYELENVYMDKKDPWSGISMAAAYAVRSTYHATLHATPGQLMFGQDVTLNVKHIADWKLIQEQKQHLININNARENKSRIEHTYQENDKVLLE